MHEYIIETDRLSIELVEPQIRYAEDIWNFRQEIINNDANSEDQFIDGTEGYHIGYSLKDAGKKCFGINRIEGIDDIKDIMKKAQQTGT